MLALLQQHWESNDFLCHLASNFLTFVHPPILIRPFIHKQKSNYNDYWIFGAFFRRKKLWLLVIEKLGLSKVQMFFFWRWHIAFWYLETHSFCLCGFLSTFYFIKVCWTMTFMAIILQQRFFFASPFFTNNNALFFFLSRSEYRQAMMKTMSSTLVETVSIDYEDFNESFLTCGTCLCKYSYI